MGTYTGRLENKHICIFESKERVYFKSSVTRKLLCSSEWWWMAPGLIANHNYLPSKTKDVIILEARWAITVLISVSGPLSPTPWLNINDSMKYVSFGAWLPHTQVSLWFIHAIACFQSSSLNRWVPFHCRKPPGFVQHQQLVDIWVVSLFIIMDKSDMNFVLKSLCVHIFLKLVCPRLNVCSTV